MEKTGYYSNIFAITLLLIFCQAVTAWSQTDRIGDFMRAGAEDAEALTKAYLEPIPSGIAGGLNTGWFNSASTHKPLGFDIQIRGALAFVPSSDQSFNFNDLDLNRVELAQGQSPISPTAAGDDSRGPLVNVNDENGDKVGEFNLPQGSGFDFVPAPMVQASVGLIKNTDVIVRFVPEVKIGEYGDFNLKGIGLKHSLSQWLPGIVPVDISLMAGYSRININADLDLDPPQPDPTTNYDNQRVETSFDTFTARLIVGKSLPFISFYGSLGYETSTMNLDVLGNYPISVSGPGGVEHTETITNPFAYTEDGDNEFSFSSGFKFKLAFFNIFGEYTLAKYSVANAGIGFSFR